MAVTPSPYRLTRNACSFSRPSVCVFSGAVCVAIRPNRPLRGESAARSPALAPRSKHPADRSAQVLRAVGGAVRNLKPPSLLWHCPAPAQALLSPPAARSPLRVGGDRRPSAVTPSARGAEVPLCLHTSNSSYPSLSLLVGALWVFLALHQRHRRPTGGCERNVLRFPVREARIDVEVHRAGKLVHIPRSILIL